MERRDTERAEKVKAITFILTLPCGPYRDEKWAERFSWALVAVLPRGGSIRWMWEIDKEAKG